MAVRAYIGLGSNLANPVSQIQTAFLALAKIPHSELIKHSGLYKSPPLPPVVDQPDFINAVAALDTQLTASELILELQKIEVAQERIRTTKWGPRTLDLDLLLYGTTASETAELTLPHPGLTTRNFVILPLLEIDPGVQLPSGEPLSNYVTALTVKELEILN